MSIKVYWREHCSQCKSVIEYFEEKKLSVDTIDVTYDQDKFREMLSLGGIATPLIVIGEHVVHSFDRQKLDRMLEGVH
jgi:glutaredoxin